MSKYLESVENLIEARLEVFRTENSVTDRNNLPDTGTYPHADNHWFKIQNVICLFVDIRNSTGLSASSHEKSTASVYELFTGTAVRMFHQLGARYIDIKGDGVFALFNENQAHRAFVSAVTFKTFAQEKFLPLIREKLNGAVEIGFHMGIEQKTVLVKQIGLRDSEGRDRRKNEVWAGKPINMAAKLAARSNDKELLVSDRYYNSLSKDIHLQKTCGCTTTPSDSYEEIDIWSPRDCSEDRIFDFDLAYSMSNIWCSVHGKEWAEAILSLDD
jgi:class 3 adenylate cyclase